MNIQNKKRNIIPCTFPNFAPTVSNLLRKYQVNIERCTSRNNDDNFTFKLQASAFRTGRLQIEDRDFQIKISKTFLDLKLINS